MIDFSLTEEQKALQKLARDFARNEMAPVAAEYDESGEFPWPIIRKAHELGLVNTIIPEEYGGMGGSAIEECIVAEELFAGCAGMGASMLANNLAIMPIIKKTKWASAPPTPPRSSLRTRACQKRTC